LIPSSKRRRLRGGAHGRYDKWMNHTRYRHPKAGWPFCGEIDDCWLPQVRSKHCRSAVCETGICRPCSCGAGATPNSLREPGYLRTGRNGLYPRIGQRLTPWHKVYRPCQCRRCLRALAECHAGERLSTRRLQIGRQSASHPTAVRWSLDRCEKFPALSCVPY
jgi:hypothetical protein